MNEKRSIDWGLGGRPHRMNQPSEVNGRSAEGGPTVIDLNKKDINEQSETTVDPWYQEQWEFDEALDEAEYLHRSAEFNRWLEEQQRRAVEESAQGDCSFTPAPDAKHLNQSSDDHDTKVFLRRHRCRSRACPTCGPRIGYQTRQAMLQRASHFETPALLTLTIDEKGTKTGQGFESPYDAYEYVRAGGYIRRLMQKLKVKTWIWVLEFQKETGNAHWHVLIDLPKCNLGNFVRKARHYWWELWKIGDIDLRFQKFANPEHAICYITKYMTKPGGFPAWFLELSGVRMVGASRNLGRLVMDDKYATDELPEEDQEEEEEQKERKEFRPLYQRVGRCSQQTDVFESRTDKQSGKKQIRYVGTLPVEMGTIINDLNRQEVFGVAPYQVNMVSPVPEFDNGLPNVYIGYGIANRTENIKPSELFSMLESHYERDPRTAEWAEHLSRRCEEVKQDYDNQRERLKAEARQPEIDTDMICMHDRFYG